TSGWCWTPAARTGCSCGGASEARRRRAGGVSPLFRCAATGGSRPPLAEWALDTPLPPPLRLIRSPIVAVRVVVMSFRLFIYYCALCGGGAAFAGWVAGRVVADSPGLLNTGIKGLWLGLSVALALGLVDVVWSRGLT